MLLTSLKENDTAFVAKAITEHKLTEHPETGFHAQSDYWMETTRWKRVIERYSWGVVLFISDRDRRSHATIVCVGKVDLVNGKVSTHGGWHDVKPDWYKEMAMELAAYAKRGVAKLEIPPCLGFHVPDVTCDGGKNEVNRMEPPCSWRDRCCALQAFAQNNGRLQENLIKGKPPEQIYQMTTRLLTNAGQTPKPPAKKQEKFVEEKQQPPVARNTHGVDPGQGKAVLDLVKLVTSEVASATGLTVSADYTKMAADSGALYLIDRTANSDYISIYQAVKPKARALASFRVRARVGLLVQLPIPKASSLFDGIIEVDVRDWKDGAFQSAVREVPFSGIRLEHIKRIIIAIIKAGE